MPEARLGRFRVRRVQPSDKRVLELVKRRVTEAPSPVAVAKSPSEYRALIRVRSMNAGMSASGFRVVLRSLHYLQKFRGHGEPFVCAKVMFPS